MKVFAHPIKLVPAGNMPEIRGGAKSSEETGKNQDFFG
jgi:hypothetical protein